MKLIQRRIISVSNKPDANAISSPFALFVVTEVSKVCNENRDRCYWMKLGSYDYQEARDV